MRVAAAAGAASWPQGAKPWLSGFANDLRLLLAIMLVTAEQTLLHLETMQRASRLRSEARAAHLRDRLPQAQRLLVEEYGAGAR